MQKINLSEWIISGRKKLNVQLNRSWVGITDKWLYAVLFMHTKLHSLKKSLLCYTDWASWCWQGAKLVQLRWRSSHKGALILIAQEAESGEQSTFGNLAVSHTFRRSLTQWYEPFSPKLTWKTSLAGTARTVLHSRGVHEWFSLEWCNTRRTFLSEGERKSEIVPFFITNNV